MAKKAKRASAVQMAAKPAIHSILQVDARITVGMFFTLTGTILSAFGYSTRDRADLYVKSQGIDANLWCGLAMLVFGIVMLALGRRAQMKLEQAGDSEPS